MSLEVFLPRSCDAPAPAGEAEFGRFAPNALTARLIAAARRCGPGWAASRRAFALRASAIRLTGGAALDVVTFGAKMRLRAADNSCEKRLIYTPQYFDAAERAFLAARLPERPIFLDVGANVGGYSLFVAERRPGALTIAVEPQPDICARLAYHVRVNAGCGVRVVECALADREGEAQLFVDPSDRSRASMRVLAGEGEQEMRRVACTTLLALCRQERLDRLDALKIDAGGADELALDPFFANAPRRLWPRQLIVDATSPASADLAARIAALGYHRVARTRANHVFTLDGEP